MLLFHRPLFFFGHAQKIPFFGHAQKINPLDGVGFQTETSQNCSRTVFQLVAFCLPKGGTMTNSQECREYAKDCLRENDLPKLGLADE